jgi:hypothetical protein
LKYCKNRPNFDLKEGILRVKFDLLEQLVKAELRPMAENRPGFGDQVWGTAWTVFARVWGIGQGI